MIMLYWKEIFPCNKKILAYLSIVKVLTKVTWPCYFYIAGPKQNSVLLKQNLDFQKEDLKMIPQ